MVVVMMVAVMIVVVMMVIMVVVIMVMVPVAVMVTVVVMVVVGHWRRLLVLVVRSPLFCLGGTAFARNVQISSKDVQARSGQRGIGCANLTH